MSYRISDKEIESVLRLAGAERVEHFVKRVADQERLWGLRAPDGWVSGDFDGEGKPAFPVWPHEHYAAACASGAWTSAEPAPIALQEFIEDWLPDMARQDVPIAVFPTPQGLAVTMAAMELSAALEAELENY